jgi:hypothetical protein
MPLRFANCLLLGWPQQAIGAIAALRNHKPLEDSTALAAAVGI